MATWAFRLPTVEEGPASWEDMLFIRVKVTRGVSIQENPQGVYRALRFPTQDEIKDAYFFYMGGHEYEVGDADKAALIAADLSPYDVTESNFTLLIPDPYPGFGEGPYGDGPYGE